MGSNALNSAISGLQADSTWLDVIGNNIANVNTVGYKSSSVSFANQFSQSLASGSGDNLASEMGGVDPEQAGSGTRVQTIQTNFSDGVIQQTGVSSDVAIQGNGFLVAKSGSNTYLTRMGNLNFDSNGFLVDSSGAFIQGYNATLQYAKTTINSYSSVGTVFPPGQVPAQITQASYQLNTSDAANITNIQINPNVTMPPKATTKINFQGNLDAFQQATTNGGVLNLNPNGKPTLPLGADLDAFLAMGTNIINPNVGVLAPIGAGPVSAGTSYALQQTADFADTNGQPILLGGMNTTGVIANAGNYAWEQQPPDPPAAQIEQTVYDSTGNPHQITVLFYQVNDLGPGGINNASGPNQTAYAWYAFDTTGGKPVATVNILGGTGMYEGNFPSPIAPEISQYDQGTLAQFSIGDFITFNTDGSLQTPGAGIGIGPNVLGIPTTPPLSKLPDIYLPVDNSWPPVSPIPSAGAEIMQVTLNFGTFGPIGTGQRDGLTGDAAGSYQVVNGVNTYVPDSHMTTTQNGYQDGDLQSVQFDGTGKIVGSFSNGQTQDLAQVAVATVNNEGGLSAQGEGHYQTTSNSGSIQLGLAGSNGTGTIAGNSLEGSNVDLSIELTNMIIAQKGFDTNARMITTVSQDLQTIAQLGQ